MEGSQSYGREAGDRIYEKLPPHKFALYIMYWTEAAGTQAECMPSPSAMSHVFSAIFLDSITDCGSIRFFTPGFHSDFVIFVIYLFHFIFLAV